jgi:hypothetical protein
LAETVDEALQRQSEFPQKSLPAGSVAPRPERHSDSRIVPPPRMDARQSSHDLLALFDRRRYRPLGRDEMRVRQIFEQQMPGAILRGLHGFKTSRH